MGFNGFIISVNASLNRMERKNRRQQRKTIKEQEMYLKQEKINSVYNIIQKYEESLLKLKSLHQECSPNFSWELLCDTKEPIKLLDQHEKIALHKYSAYQPSLIDKLFRLQKIKKKRLLHTIEKAKEKDKSELLDNIKNYDKALIQWHKDQKIAKSILEKDITVYAEAYFEYLEEKITQIDYLGAKISLQFTDNKTVVDLFVHSNTSFPNVKLSQLKSGDLSKKSMPKGEFHENYQLYICSCILRIAREIFAFYPIDELVVNAIDDILNPSTGHLEEQAILSVLIPKKTLEQINFNTINPPDTLKNFIHRMEFKKL